MSKSKPNRKRNAALTVTARTMTDQQLAEHLARAIEQQRAAGRLVQTYAAEQKRRQRIPDAAA